MATATLFAPIAKQRVTAGQPASVQDRLDADRCAALHNTMLLYGWVCSGKKINQMEKRSWWGKHGNDSLKKILHPAVVRYLSKVFDVPGHNFFYHISGLATAKEMLELGDVLEDEEHDKERKLDKHRFIILYKSLEAMVSHPAGIVFDQDMGKAILMPTYSHVFNLEKDLTLPWQPLENILSAYVDMIEAEKAIALHDNVYNNKDIASKSDPKTNIGISKHRMQYQTRPWILQPYTIGDLRSCLEVWKRLVDALEERSGTKRELCEDDDEPEQPLASPSALNVAGIARGFAYELLTHAQHSQIWFVAPGIRLPKIEEFLRQPFKTIMQQYPEETEGMKMPFLFLRCPGEVSAKEAKFRYPFSKLESVPCGLYLDAFPNAQNPFEDACRLVLPIKIGASKHAYARTADFQPISRSHSDLYQIEINPFVMRHGPKLVAVLENWLENVESGHWSVNEKGVEGGVGVWRQADTRENWWRYQGKHLSV